MWRSERVYREGRVDKEGTILKEARGRERQCRTKASGMPGVAPEVFPRPSSFRSLQPAHYPPSLQSIRLCRRPADRADPIPSLSLSLTLTRGTRWKEQEN